MLWGLLVLAVTGLEVLGVRWLCHRAFHHGYRTAVEIYELHRQGNESADYWDRQRALAKESKKA